MKASKKAKTIRIGNRFGKTEIGMAVDSCSKPRRSIPIAEVNDMIERKVRQVKASLTIYDDRNSLLEDLNENEDQISGLEQCLHSVKLRNKTLRTELAQINTAIRRQLELDGE